MSKPYKRFNVNNLDGIAEFELTEENNFPVLSATPAFSEKIIPFNYALSCMKHKKHFDSYIHFFIEDYQFERVWQNPKRYLSVFTSFKGIISPDFSLFRNIPITVQKWNVYRNRYLAAYYTKAGIEVIPSAGWSDERSYSFCFESLPVNSTVAISTNGCLTNNETLDYFTKGFCKMLETLKPSAIINYGRPVKQLFDNCGVPVKNFESFSQLLYSKLGSKKKGA